jgi:GDP-L-fucose synthase
MKILLTGASGLLGKNFVSSYSNKRELLTPSSSELDLKDKNAISAYLVANKPDIIVHAAGVVGGIQDNSKHPVKYFYDNLLMTMNLITAATENEITQFLNVSSANIYSESAGMPLEESAIMSGSLDFSTEGYSLAKLTSLKFCELVNRENSKFSYKSIIPCNFYGVFDHFVGSKSHMIPGLIQRVHEAKTSDLPYVEIWGDGNARREFMYIGDLVDFINYAITNFANMPQNLNVGLGKDYSINEYYKIVSKTIGYEGYFKHDLSKPVGVKQKLLSNIQLKNFGWEYKTSIEDGIKQTYDFYLSEYCND